MTPRTKQWRLDFSAVRKVGMDETAAARGQDYVSIFTDLVERGVLYATEGRVDTPDTPGTPQLFARRFATPDGGTFIWIDHRDRAEMPDSKYPYALTTGQIMQQYQSGNQTSRSRSLQATARGAGCRDPPGPGPAARHRDRRPGGAAHPPGLAVFRAHLTDAIRSDTIFAPFHWGGRPA